MYWLRLNIKPIHLLQHSVHDKTPYYISLAKVLTLHDPDSDVACSTIEPADNEDDNTRLVVFPMSLVANSAYSTLLPFHTVTTVPALAFVPDVVTKSKNADVYELVLSDITVAVEPDVTDALLEYCIKD